MNHLEPCPRQPLRALLMSLVLPGLGQLYNGQAEKAIWLVLAFAFLSVPAVTLAALYVPAAMMVPALAVSVLASVGVWIFGMMDAWRTARTLAGHVARPWQSLATYVLVLVLCQAIALPLLIMSVREHLVESFYVPSTSMEPGVLKGDVFFADKRYNCPHCKLGVARGDIALFASPNDRTQIHIKRIIALPGDTVAVRGRLVTVNGKALSSKIAPEHEDGQMVESWGERKWQVAWLALPIAPPDADLTVPPGHVFVLGDNRSNSLDSRNFGTVPLTDVVGKARQVWFSRGDAGIRSERIGKVLE
jgi:signal peptidase I